MIKRSINPRFREAVLSGRKTTTIRNRPWPVGVPIMLYSWSGRPYRSVHTDVAPIVVTGFWTIRITHREDGSVHYECGKESGPALYETEGFASQAEMDAWFRPLGKQGQTKEKALMEFKVSNGVTCH